MSVAPSTTEPLELWRAWNYDGRHLQSPLLHGAEWIPGKAMTADCLMRDLDFAAEVAALESPELGDGRPVVWEWTLELDEKYDPAIDRQHDLQWAVWQTQIYNRLIDLERPRLRVPTMEPPAGYGYKLVPVDEEATPAHESPVFACVCGIYALDDVLGLPAGDIFGKVKLWGKIVRGTLGARAQHAYPSMLFVPPGMEEDMGLLAYGVPLIPISEPPPPDMPRALAA